MPSDVDKVSGISRYHQRLRRNIRLYYLTGFFEGLMFMIPVWVAFERQYLTFSQMSLLGGVSFALTVLLELPTGAFADLVGRKISVAIGFLIQVAGLLTIAFATSWLPIVIGELIRAVGETFVSGSYVALLYDTTKELKIESTFSKIRGKGVMILQYGIVLSSVCAGYLFAISKGLPYAAYGIALLVNGALYVLMQEPKIDTEKFTLRNYLKQTKLGLMETMKNQYVRSFSIFFALVAGITWSWQLYFNQIYATNIGYSEIGKGWLFALIRLSSVLVISKLISREELLTKPRAFVLFPILLLVASIPASLSWKPLGTVLLFLMTASSTLRFVVLEKFANEVFESKYRATALSALNLYLSLVYIVIVTLSGPILDRFPAGVVYGVIGFVVLFLVLPRGLALARNSMKSG